MAEKSSGKGWDLCFPSLFALEEEETSLFFKLGFKFLDFLSITELQGRILVDFEELTYGS